VKRIVRKESTNKIKAPASQLEWGRKGESWAWGSCGLQPTALQIPAQRGDVYKFQSLKPLSILLR
jgi:hypothetical protein